MAFSRFQATIFLRVTLLVATLAVLAWMMLHTMWYVTMAIFIVAAAGQVHGLIKFASKSGREVARFLDAVAFDDNTVSFSALSRDGAFADLSAAMTRVLDQLRMGPAEREEQAQYLQSVIAHLPVALISIDEHGAIQLLN